MTVLNWKNLGRGWHETNEFTIMKQAPKSFALIHFGVTLETFTSVAEAKSFAEELAGA